MDGYQVRLPAFHGPLDLLLFLVKRHEVDVRDIPIASITEQYGRYLDVLAVIDFESVGEFLVTAATLLEIKSREAIPGTPQESGDAGTPADDPRRDLVEQLIEYKKYKEAAARLGSKAAEAGRRLPRERLDTGPAAPSAPVVHTPELWDLVSAFGRLIQDAGLQEPEHVLSDDTPQSVYREEVIGSMTAGTVIPFRAVFRPPLTRMRLIGLFLALLELVKSGDVVLSAGDPPDEILLAIKATPENSDAG
jgi:segregation and condensation protein A